MKMIKIFLVAAGIFFNSSAIIFFLLPDYQEFQALNHREAALNLQWQEQQRKLLYQRQRRNDLILQQHQYEKPLGNLHQTSSLSVLLNQLTRLAGMSDLQISALKPQKQNNVSGLKQQMLALDVSGDESLLLNFFRLLFHQCWLTEIQHLQLSTAAPGMRAQATLAFYYAEN